MSASLRELAPPGIDEHLKWLRAQPPCDAPLTELVARSPPAPAAQLLDNVVTTQFENHLRILFDAGVP